MYEQYGSIQGYLETLGIPEFLDTSGSIKRKTFAMKLLTNVTFTHCSSVQCLEIFPQ